jgi:lysophospholipase L1-like esterase
MAVPRRWRDAAGTAALALLGLAAGLIALELCLHAGAWYVRGTQNAPPRLQPDAVRRVLCLGDSNTYGLYVGREHAYPARLSAALEAVGKPAVEITNLGYPGTTSSALRNRLASALARYRPQLVTVMVGANDGWTVPEPIPGEPGATRMYRLWRYSRVFRLLFMATRAWAPATSPAPADAPQVIRAGPGGTPGWTYALRWNLTAIAAAVRAAGGEPVLVTYPSESSLYGDANTVMRTTAREAGIRLLDVTPAFVARCPAGTCPELLPDQHPSIAGHALVAQTMAALLAAPDEPAEPAR